MTTTRQGWELFSAARVVTEHAAGGNCNQCTSDGCRLYDWADFLLQQWERRHGQRYPGYAPSWQAVKHAPGRL